MTIGSRSLIGVRRVLLVLGRIVSQRPCHIRARFRRLHRHFLLEREFVEIVWIPSTVVALQIHRVFVACRPGAAVRGVFLFS